MQNGLRGDTRRSTWERLVRLRSLLPSAVLCGVGSLFAVLCIIPRFEEPGPNRNVIYAILAAVALLASGKMLPKSSEICANRRAA